MCTYILYTKKHHTIHFEMKLNEMNSVEFVL